MRLRVDLEFTSAVRTRSRESATYELRVERGGGGWRLTRIRGL
jgi:hypothetical protein